MYADDCRRPTICRMITKDPSHVSLLLVILFILIHSVYFQRIRGSTRMRYINLLLLTYLLTYYKMSPSCIVYRVSYERATVSVFLSVCYSDTQNSITLIHQRDTDSGRQVAVGTEWIGKSVKCDNRQPAGPGCCTFDSNGETGFPLCRTGTHCSYPSPKVDPGAFSGQR